MNPDELIIINALSERFKSIKPKGTLKPYHVGEKLLLVSPHAPELAIEVNYRGKIGDQATVVYDGGKQMTIPIAWLQRLEEEPEKKPKQKPKISLSTFDQKLAKRLNQSPEMYLKLKEEIKALDFSTGTMKKNLAKIGISIYRLLDSTTRSQLKALISRLRGEALSEEELKESKADKIKRIKEVLIGNRNYDFRSRNAVDMHILGILTEGIESLSMRLIWMPV